MKKLLSILMVCAMLFALVLPASAASTSLTTAQGNPRIARILPDVAFYTYEGDGAVAPETTRPGSEIIIPLVKEGFKDANDQEIYWADHPHPSLPGVRLGPSVSDLKRNNVVPHLKFSAGKDVIRDIEIVKYTPTRRVHAQAAIRIRFVEKLVSTEEFVYQFQIGLLLNGNPTYAREKFGGMISNRKINVTPISGVNLIYADLYNGDAVLYCTESTDSVQVDLDNGLYAQLDMVANGKFYGYCELDGDGVRDDEIRNLTDPVMKEYEEVRYCYKVVTVNVKNQIKYMTITIPDDKNYYVYNVYGEYIGMSKDKLPYSSKYYLSTAEIEIDPDLAGLPEYQVDMGRRGNELKQFIALPSSGTPTLD